MDNKDHTDKIDSLVNDKQTYEPPLPLKLRQSNVEIMVFRLIERNLWAITFA